MYRLLKHPKKPRLETREFLYIAIGAGSGIVGLIIDNPSVWIVVVLSILTLLIQASRSPRAKQTEIIAKQSLKKIEAVGEEIGVSAYCIDAAFLTKQSAGYGELDPREFYSLKRGAIGWLSLLQDWDTARSYDQELLEHVLRADVSESRLPVAAIVGSGGSGKSISLRRLAITLQRQNAEVWWTDDPKRLVRGLPKKFAAASDRSVYLLIDDIHKLTNEEALILLDNVLSTATMKTIVAGQSLPGTLRRHIGQLLISTDARPDLKAILHKIAEKVPEWTAAAHEIEAKARSGPRLVHLLLVLARAGSTGGLSDRQRVESIEKSFLAVLASEATEIKEVHSGLFYTVIDIARLQSCNIRISIRTMTAMIEASQPDLQTQKLLASREPDGWACTRNLLFFSESNVSFHHDEFAVGLLRALQDDAASKSILLNDTTEQMLLEHIIKLGRPSEASQAAYALIQRYPKVAGTQKAVVILDQLIKAGNPHPEYQQIIYHKKLPLTEDERINRIMQMAARAEGAVGLAQWIRRVTHSRSERALLLQKLFDAGCRDDLFIADYLNHASSSRRQAAIKELIQKEALTDAQKITYLKFGGKSAEQYARKLLRHSGESLLVRGVCVELLRGKAKKEAHQLMKDALREYKGLEPFKSAILSLGPEGKKYALEALHDATLPASWREFCVIAGGKETKPYALEALYQSATEPLVLAACISKVGATNKPRVAEILRSNRHRSVVAVCLKVLQRDAAAEAQQLLREGSMPDSVINQCLNLLDPEVAAQYAKKLLQRETMAEDLRAKCVKLLGLEHLKSHALELLGNWRECSDEDLAWSLRVAVGSPETVEAVRAKSAQWDKLSPPLKAAVLRNEIDKPLQQQRASRILKHWRDQPPQLLVAAISVTPDASPTTFKICQLILEDWRKEIKRRPGKYSSIKQYDGHVIKALAHPKLHGQAKKVAKQMIKEEEHRPGTLSTTLHAKAKDIVVSGRSPIWAHAEQQNA